MNELAMWINFQLRQRGWGPDDLAERAGLSRTAVSVVLAGQHRAGPRFCYEVARVLGEPEERLLGLAGLTSPRHEHEEINISRDELLGLYDRMTPEAQLEIQRIAQSLAEWA